MSLANSFCCDRRPFEPRSAHPRPFDDRFGLSLGHSWNVPGTRTQAKSARRDRVGAGEIIVIFGT